MLRCGATVFQRVQLLVFKVIGKSGGWSFAACKNRQSGPAKSLMRPTERVTCLRATNNSCLYSFSSLILFVAHSFSFPLQILVPRCSSFLPFLFSVLFSSFPEVIRTRVERSRWIYRSRMPLPAKSLVPVSNLIVTSDQ